MSEMIERVAKAMRADYIGSHNPNRLAWEEIDDGMRAIWRQHARAAIEAMREPTEAMVSAMIGPHYVGLDLEQATQRLQVCVWNAGIDAALSQPPHHLSGGAGTEEGT
jgi:hypothetical protein